MRESAIALSLNHIINPLVTNDAYMHPIMECAKVPMTHICVRCEVCALTVCSAATSGQCL